MRQLEFLLLIFKLRAGPRDVQPGNNRPQPPFQFLPGAVNHPATDGHVAVVGGIGATAAGCSPSDPAWFKKVWSWSSPERSRAQRGEITELRSPTSALFGPP